MYSPKVACMVYLSPFLPIGGGKKQGGISCLCAAILDIKVLSEEENTNLFKLGETYGSPQSNYPTSCFRGNHPNLSGQPPWLVQMIFLVGITFVANLLYRPEPPMLQMIFIGGNPLC